MIHQRQPNRWSCLPTSFAICMDIPVADLISRIGHDGSEIKWPHLEEPRQRLCFNDQEIIEVALRLGYFVTPFDTFFTAGPSPEDCVMVDDMERTRKLISHFNGVICGRFFRSDNKLHAMAWEASSKTIYDPSSDYPTPRVANFDEWIHIERFYVVGVREEC